MKRCPRCEQTKPLDEFYRRGETGVGGWCKDCVKADRKAVYAADPEPIKARVRARVEAEPRKVRDEVLRRLYGITLDDYEAMLDRQGGHCATCPSTERLGVDHCHESGVVRGLLCNRCNLVLGMVGDDPVVLEAMVGYLLAAQLLTGTSVRRKVPSDQPTP